MKLSWDAVELRTTGSVEALLRTNQCSDGSSVQVLYWASGRASRQIDAPILENVESEYPKVR